MEDDAAVDEPELLVVDEADAIITLLWFDSCLIMALNMDDVTDPTLTLFETVEWSLVEVQLLNISEQYWTQQSSEQYSPSHWVESTAKRPHPVRTHWRLFLLLFEMVPVVVAFDDEDDDETSYLLLLLLVLLFNRSMVVGQVVEEMIEAVTIFDVDDGGSNLILIIIGVVVVFVLFLIVVDKFDDDMDKADTDDDGGGGVCEQMLLFVVDVGVSCFDVTAIRSIWSNWTFPSQSVVPIVLSSLVWDDDMVDGDDDSNEVVDEAPWFIALDGPKSAFMYDE